MLKAPIQPPTRQDLLIFQGFQRAVVEKKAYIKINFKALNKFGSPFFNPWENILPLFLILSLSVATMIVNNLIAGTVILTILILGYALLMPYFLEPFMQNRVVKRIVPRIEKFLIAWRYGGFTVYLAADPHFYCASPQGDWRKFVQTYFSDLIPEDTADTENAK